MYRHIEEKSDATNKKIDKLLHIVNSSFSRLEQMTNQRLDSANQAYQNNTLNLTPNPQQQLYMQGSWDTLEEEVLGATNEKWQRMSADERNARLDFENRFETDITFQEECVKATRQAFMASDRD